MQAATFSARRLLLPLFQTRPYAAKTRKPKKVEPDPVLKHKGKRSKPSDFLEAQLPGEKFDMTVLDDTMKKAIERLRVNLNSVVSRVGRVSAAILDPLRVDMDGHKSKLHDYASVSVKDPTTMLVTVFDKSAKHIGPVERALASSKASLSPIKIGDNLLKVTISKPDWKVRERLTQEASTLCENARASIRAARHQGQKDIKRDEKGVVISQNEAHTESKRLDELTKKHTATVDSIFSDAKRVLMDE